MEWFQIIRNGLITSHVYGFKTAERIANEYFQIWEDAIVFEKIQYKNGSIEFKIKSKGGKVLFSLKQK